MTKIHEFYSCIQVFTLKLHSFHKNSRLMERWESWGEEKYGGTSLFGLHFWAVALMFDFYQKCEAPENTHNKKMHLPARTVREFPRLWPQLRETMVCALKKPFKEEWWWCSPGLSPHKQCLTLNLSCLSCKHVPPDLCACYKFGWLAVQRRRYDCPAATADLRNFLLEQCICSKFRNKQFHDQVSWNNFLFFYCCVLLMLLLSVFSVKLLFPSFTGFFFLF